MTKEKPYCILSPKFVEQGIDAGWEIDEESYETPGKAFEVSCKKYPDDKTFVIKICFPTDD
jgi:hypothetical protein